MRSFALLLVACLLPCTVAAQEEASPAVDPAFFEDFDFRMVGPSRGGRVTTVAGHVNHPNTFYFGSTGGGVWKTTDAGETWRNCSDGYFASASIGAIRVAPSADSIIYVGTGSDGLRSNVIVGRGFYKSTDGCKTWTDMGLRDMGQLTSVEVHPTDPNLLYVAALGNPFKATNERGVYKSADGGETWERVLFVSDSTGAVDLELNPADPNEIYAAMWRAERKPWTIISGDADESGIYKSTDAGATWTKLSQGLPQDLVGKIDLAVSPANPNRLYALVEAPDAEEGLYRSDDRGETFTFISDKGDLMSRPFYYTNVDADPTNADIVYVNNLGFWKSEDGGETFSRIRTPHGDNHDMWIHPEQTDVFIQANDGGVNVTLDGGQTWTTQHNQSTAELYQVNVDERFPYWLYAGQQDNTTIRVPSLPPAQSGVSGAESWWEAVGGCETGPAIPKPGNADIVYSNCKGRFGRYNARTGQEWHNYVGAQNMYGRNPAELIYRFQRVVPIEVSPHDPDIIYHGSQFVHRTNNDGRTWHTISPDLTAQPEGTQMISGGPITRDITGEEHYSTLYEIRESLLEPGVLWAGSNDGPVHVSRDGGETWADVTPADLPPMGRVETIDVSPHQASKAYFAAYRYLLGDFEPYIYKTEDYGQTWTRLTDGTNGIPADYPTRVIREDPAREGLLYAGTDFGLFISFDDGDSWQPFQLDLPVTPITDIKVHRNDLVLSTMGRGFWILDNLTPLHQLDTEALAASQQLFAPREAHRMRYRTFRAGPHAPEYAPPGATIDFYVAEQPEAEVRLDILDADGRLIRRFSSAGEAEEEEEDDVPVMHTEATAAGPVPQEDLAVQAGHNRFLWNLRYAGAWSNGRVRGNGPYVTPGTYQIRLTIDDWSQMQPLTIRMDPRVAEDGVTAEDLDAQLTLNLAIRDLLSNARQTAKAIKDAQEQLEEDASQHAALAELHAALVTADEGSYPPPMLISQIQYLAGMTSRADYHPGQDAYTRYDMLKADLAEISAAWEDMLQRLDVPSTDTGR